MFRAGPRVCVVPRQGCLFCGSTAEKISREHLFHRSFGERIPHSPSIWRHRYNPGSDEHGEDTAIPHSMFEQKINGICKKCNSGWMNQMDTDIEEAIVELATARREPVLHTNELAPLARWATKVALLRAYADKSSGWQPHESSFRAFYETREPLPGSVVRVGLAQGLLKEGGSNGFLALGTDKLDRRVTDDDDLALLNIVSWAMGGLYLHVIVPSPAPLAQSVASDASEKIARIAGPRVQMIHPTRNRATRFTGPLTINTAARIGNLSHLVIGTNLRPLDFEDRSALPDRSARRSSS